MIPLVATADHLTWPEAVVLVAFGLFVAFLFWLTER